MLKLSPLFTDGAVLCRGKEIRIFGQADAGAAVRAELTGLDGRRLAEAETAANADGSFTALLAPQKAQTGCVLTLTDGTDTVVSRDIAVGDVYLAGGQSNMEWMLQNAKEGPAEMAGHDDPDLRFFNIPRRAYFCEEQKETMARTRWEAIAPGKGGENSAVAYFFARALRARHGDVPVGIIGCYWGGTSITCWIQEEALKRTAEGTAYLTRDVEAAGGKSLSTYLEEEKVFQDTLNAWNGEVDACRRSHPEASWKEIEEICGPCPWNPPAGPGSPFRPAGLAETMLSQAVPAALTGILWYQGESDADQTDHYDELMLTLIRTWRARFQDAELPFLFVQLPMFLGWDADDTFRWPALRLAQAAARDAARNSGMICLLDEGEYGNLHPTAKRAVGERLHELAEVLIYGEDGAVSPRATGKRTEGGNLTVTLSGPVKVRNGERPALMEIAGADGRFVPAWAAASGKELRLWNPEVAHPVHARYAWTDWSDQVNVFGENGLPLEPFSL